MRFVLSCAIFVLIGICLFIEPVWAATLAEQVTDQLAAGGEQAGFERGALPLPVFINGLVQIVLALLGSLFVVLNIIGGFYIFNARGRDDWVTKGSTTVRQAATGLIVVLAAYAISLAVGYALQGIIGIGPEDCAPRQSSGGISISRGFNRSFRPDCDDTPVNFFGS